MNIKLVQMNKKNEQDSIFGFCSLFRDCLYRSYQGDLFFTNYIMRVNSRLKLWEETVHGQFTNIGSKKLPIHNGTL